MFRRTLPFIVGTVMGIGLSLIPLSQERSLAQVADNENCASAINNAVASETRLFRAVLYGMPKAERAAIGSLRYDGDGNPWVKTGVSQWRSVDAEIGDSDMDARAEFADRQGLFQTHRVLTSELLPFMLDSFYSLDCNLHKTCDFVEQSFDQDAASPQTATSKPDGCREFEGETLPLCHLKRDDNDTAGQEGFVVGYCGQLAKQTLAREALMLRTAAEYDASYRTMLQFAGEFDLFLSQFRTPIANTIRQTAGVIGWLNRIPCFAASCADYPYEP